MTTVAAVSVEGVDKSFGAARVLRDIHLDLTPGEIHAFVGSNGAGKSTLLGVLAGRLSATAGGVKVFGTDLEPGSPRASRAAGIAAIYQELTIVPALSAQANVFLGHEMVTGTVLDERGMRQAYQDLCQSLGVACRRDVSAGTLSVAEQQMLEIMRALTLDARLILLDEPTASLAEAERATLLSLMGKLRERGVTQVIVSHNLEEVLAIADRVWVFRDGELTETRPAGEWSKQALVEAMLGAELEMVEFRDTRTTLEEQDVPLLRVEDVVVPGRVHGVTLTVRHGEVLGIGGLVGSGRTSLLRALAGLEPKSSGRIWINGVERSWPRNVRAALRLGVALIPEDRKGTGLVLQASAVENVVMGDQRSVSRWGVKRPRVWRASAKAALRPLAFDTARLGERTGNLSGGNQQKQLVARWFHAPPLLLLADEPTRGIDIGAKTDVLAAIAGQATGQTGVILVSSELEEVLALSNRVVVLGAGQVVTELDQADHELTVKEVLSSAFNTGVVAP